MPDEPKDPKAPPDGPKDSPKAPEPRKGDDKAAPSPQPRKDAPKAEPLTFDDDEGEAEGEPAAPQEQKAAKPAADPLAPAVPGAKELEKLRAAKFGAKGGGSVRIDAPPANSDPRQGAPQIVYVDKSGREVGREDYAPEPKRNKRTGGK